MGDRWRGDAKGGLLGHPDSSAVVRVVSLRGAGRVITPEARATVPGSANATANAPRAKVVDTKSSRLRQFTRVGCLHQSTPLLPSFATALTGGNANRTGGPSALVRRPLGATFTCRRRPSAERRPCARASPIGCAATDPPVGHLGSVGRGPLCGTHEVADRRAEHAVADRRAGRTQ